MRVLLPLVLAAAAGAAERINHCGRILGPAPVVAAPVLFNTPQADAIVAAMQIVPRDSAWVERVAARPLLAGSDAMIARIKADLAAKGANRQTLRAFFEMNYVLAPDGQAPVDIRFLDYPDESDGLKPGSDDTGAWPLPSITPVETWPRERPAGETNAQWQRSGVGGDRHAIVVQPGAMRCWETWQMRLTDAGWQASNGARFDLASNALRPAGWTSGDAAGLAMFPALVRYDECEHGEVEHACRLVVGASRRAYLYPATHQAGSTDDADAPAMGQRLRLKASFAIPDGWHRHERAVARALQVHGAIVADNGGFFSISVCPDQRFTDASFAHLSSIPIDAFEVVQSTGAVEGPRAPGAPTCTAGADASGAVGAAIALAGSATGAGTRTWTLYPKVPQPGTVVFADAHAPTTTATFSAAGVYTLLLEVDDGVHAPAYDAVVVTVGGGGGGGGGGASPPTGQAPSGGGGGGCGGGAGGVALALLVALGWRR